MEARVARLEADVAHLRTDVADIKADVRGLRDKMDSIADRSDKKFDSLKDAIAETNERIADAKVWALVFYITLAAGTFGTMARAFGWL